MPKKVLLLIGIYCVVVLPACGGGNLAKDYADKEPDDEVRELLNAGEIDQAIELLVELINADAEQYFRHPILAAAYAAKGGLNLLDILKNQLNGVSSSGGDIFSQLDAILPNPLTTDHITNAENAISTLDKMPDAERTPDADIVYRSSAAFQYTLYLSILPVMKLKKFLKTTADGKFDPEVLATLTVDEALDILATMAKASGSSKNDLTAAMASTIDSTLTDINNSSGSDSREKLINYSASKK